MAPKLHSRKHRLPGMGVRSVCQCGNCSCERVRILLKLRHSLFDFAVQLFDIDVKSVAIDRTGGLEVEDTRECVAANSLLVDQAFNSVNGVLMRLVPRFSKLEIVPLPAISRLARDSGSLCGMVDRTLNSQGVNESLFLTVTFVTHWALVNVPMGVDAPGGRLGVLLVSMDQRPLA